MTPEQLKASILQRAMEGKLVPQDPNDEPTSELLKRIKKEKEKLIKEGKIKRDNNETEIFRGDDGLYYEKFQDGVIKEIEVPFEIPESWEWARLSTLSSKIHYGYTASAQDNGNAKLLRITDIQNNKVEWSTVPYCDISEDKLENMKLIDNDILIARTGGTIGKSFLIRNVSDVSVFASYLIRVQVTIGNLSDFVKKFIESPNYWSQLQEMSMGTGQPNVNATNLSTLLVPIAPFQEQQRIFKRIDEISVFAEHYEKYHSELYTLNKEFPEKLRKSILQYAMQGKLVPQDPNDEPVEVLLEKIRAEKEKLYKEGKIKKKDLEESIIYKGDDNSYYENIPSNWKQVSLGTLGKITSGGTPKSTEKRYYMGNIIWITPADMGTQQQNIFFSDSAKHITEEGLNNSSAQLIEKNSIVYSSRAPIGHINIVPFKYTTNQGCKSISPYIINNIWLYYAIIEATPRIKKEASGTTFLEISATKIAETIILLPPVAEQKRIITEVDLFFQIISQLN